MIDQQSQTHLFSLYAPDLIGTAWTVGAVVCVRDELLVHRMIKVLRFEVGQRCVLFDHQQHATVLIEQVSKKDFTIRIEHIEQHQPIQPHVTFLLPLLKKEALEQSVYSLCELGINRIQLVITQKSRQQLMGSKELLRLQNIVIAACEQSKNYALSELLPEKKLSQLLFEISEQSSKIVFDPEGSSFFTLREKMKQESAVLLVGPEGGLTQQELQELQQQKFVSCALTPTTLRAVQAVCLGAGLIRLK